MVNAMARSSGYSGHPPIPANSLSGALPTRFLSDKTDFPSSSTQGPASSQPVSAPQVAVHKGDMIKRRFAPIFLLTNL